MENETVIKWVAPPKMPGQESPMAAKWDAISEALRDRPNEWALVAENESVGVVLNQLRKRGLYVTCRGVKNGKAAEVYARFIVRKDSNVEDIENFESLGEGV